MDAKPLVNHPIFHTISKAAQSLNCEAYVIGGFVRDHILKRKEPKDIDITCTKSGIDLANAVAKLVGVKKVVVFKNFGTAQIKFKDLEIEFVGARKESYQRNSRKPIVENGTLEDDQNRRDFTINAIAISLNKQNFGEIVDPFSGMADLEQGIIQTPLAPVKTFSDDPLRMMRAIRFACQLNFTITDNCLNAIKENRNRLEIISAERICDEMHKIMLSPKPSVGIILLYKTKLLHLFLPEIAALAGVEEIGGQSHKDNFYHTAQVVDNIAEHTNKLWLRYAALFHDIGKPITKKFIKGTGWTFHHHEFVGGKMLQKIFRRMSFPLGDALKYTKKIVQLSSRPQAIVDDHSTDSAVRRLLFEAGDDIEDLMLLAEADITTQNQKKKAAFLKNFKRVREKLKEVEEKDHVRNFQPPLSGEEIMKLFNLSPGREIGLIKNAVKEAILEGEIQNDYEQAKSFAIAKAKDLGIN